MPAIPDGAVVPGSGDRRAAGWLRAADPYPTGPSGEPWAHRLFTDRLAEAARSWALGGAVHTCPWCPAISVPGEIHAVDRSGIRWAAPALVHHHVTEHGYRPPAGFVDAITAGTVDAPAGDDGSDLQPGEEIGPYGADERLDEEHTAIAVRAMADEAGVFPEAVAARVAFFVSFRLVCERAGSSRGLPRMVVGISRSGSRTWCTAGGHWDGTAYHLARIVALSMTERSCQELRDAGWR